MLPSRAAVPLSGSWHPRSMSRPRTPLPPSLGTAVFTVADAQSPGVSRRRLRGDDLLAPARGLRLRADADVTELDLAAAITGGIPGAVVSHRSAARLWGMPLPFADRVEAWTPRTPLDLTVPPDASRPRASGIRAHRAVIPPEHVRRVAGVAVTSREWTFIDLGRVVDLLQLVAVADHLLRWPRFQFEGREAPWSTPARLTALVEQAAPRWGITEVRRALARSRAGADSPQETRLRLALEDAGLPAAELNVPIRTPSGVRLHEPDLQWPLWRVAAEYEGPHHRSSEQLDRDIDRAERLRRHGWTEVRLTARDMRDGCRRAVARVAEALRESGWEPGRTG